MAKEFLNGIFDRFAVVKTRVRVVATTNLTLSGTQTVDGVAVAVGDRVLCAGQSTASQNGVYVVASGSWTRATDFDTAAKAANALVAVGEGTSYPKTIWQFPLKTTDTFGSVSVAPQQLVFASPSTGIPDLSLPARLQGSPLVITDWGPVTTSGFYRSASNATGAPANTGSAWVGVVLNDTNNVAQIVVNAANAVVPQMWMRTYDTSLGDWDAWYRIYTKSDTDTLYGRTTLGGNETSQAASGTSGTVTLDASVASVFTLSPTADITTLTISNPPASGKACTITLIVTQGATPRAIATPSGGIFYGAATPTQVANKKCIFTYMTTDAGTTWHCSGVVQV